MAKKKPAVTKKTVKANKVADDKTVNRRAVRWITDRIKNKAEVEKVNGEPDLQRVAIGPDGDLCTPTEWPYEVFRVGIIPDKREFANHVEVWLFSKDFAKKSAVSKTQNLIKAWTKKWFPNAKHGSPSLAFDVVEDHNFCVTFSFGDADMDTYKLCKALGINIDQSEKK